MSRSDETQSADEVSSGTGPRGLSKAEKLIFFDSMRGISWKVVFILAYKMNWLNQFQEWTRILLNDPNFQVQAGGKPHLLLTLFNEQVTKTLEQGHSLDGVLGSLEAGMYLYLGALLILNISMIVLVLTGSLGKATSCMKKLVSMFLNDQGGWNNRTTLNQIAFSYFVFFGGGYYPETKYPDFLNNEQDERD